MRVPVIAGQGSCLEDCWARFVPRQGLELRPRLRGGGCCQSLPVPNSSAFHDLRDLHAAKKVSIVQNQHLAQEIAEEARDLAYRGLTAGLRLTQLDDLPQVSISSPLPVAEALFEALQEEGLWAVESDFLLRQMVARLARRFYVDHLFAESAHFIETVRERLREPIKQIKKRAKASQWYDSGVIAEISALQLFISSVHDTPRVWQQVRQPKPVIGRALVFPKPPEEALPSLEQVRTVLNHSMETQLLIDDLYFQAIPQNLSALLGISCLLLEPGAGKSWKIFYQTLSFLEWCFHRELISTQHAELLKPHLMQFLTLESCSPFVKSSSTWRICEKLATLLIKASQQNLLTDLLAAMSDREPDNRIQSVLTLPARMLRLEPSSGASRNLHVARCIGRDSDVQKARALLSSEGFLSVTGMRGVGKTHFVKALAEPYEVAWLCCATSVPALNASLRCLACNLRVSFEGLFEALTHRRVLLILDEANTASLQSCRGQVPTSCHIVTTSVEPFTEASLELQPLDITASAALLGDQSARSQVLAKALPGLPLALRVGRDLGESAAEVVLQLASLEKLEEKQRLVVETWVRSVAARSQGAWTLLQILSFLSSQEAVEELYEPVFRQLRPSDSLPQAKEELHSVLDEDSKGAFSVPVVLQEAVTGLSAFGRTVTLAQHLFSDESLGITNLRMAASVERLLRVIESKEIIEEMELRLCLKWVYFCVEKLGCGQFVSELLEKACIWYRHNPRMLDFKDLPVPYYLGICFRRLGNLPRAAELLFLEVVACEKTLPQTHPDLAFAYQLLANVYYHMRNLADAETFQQKCVLIRDTIGGNAGSYSLLAAIFHEQGKLAEAEKAQIQAIRLAADSELSGIYNNLACVYLDMKDLPSALKYQELAIKLDESTLPSNHSDLAISYSNLANILRDLGQFDRAKQLQQQALHIKEEVLPTDHPLLGVSYHSMARILLAMASPAAAHEFMVKAMRIEEQAADPHRLAQYLHTMAQIEANLENFPAAKAMLERELTLRLEKLSAEQNGLSAAFHEAGKLATRDQHFEAARNYLEQALALKEKVLPLKHPEVQACCRDLAEVCKALDLTDRASELETRLDAS